MYNNNATKYIIAFSSPNPGTRKAHIALPSRRKTGTGEQMFGFEAPAPQDEETRPLCPSTDR